MYCVNCGKEIPGYVKFCPHCGTNQMTGEVIEKDATESVDGLVTSAEQPPTTHEPSSPSDSQDRSQEASEYPSSTSAEDPEQEQASDEDAEQRSDSDAESDSKAESNYQEESDKTDEADWTESESAPALASETSSSESRRARPAIIAVVCVVVAIIILVIGFAVVGGGVFSEPVTFLNVSDQNQSMKNNLAIGGGAAFSEYDVYVKNVEESGDGMKVIVDFVAKQDIKLDTSNLVGVTEYGDRVYPDDGGEISVPANQSKEVTLTYPSFQLTQLKWKDSFREARWHFDAFDTSETESADEPLSRIATKRTELRNLLARYKEIVPSDQWGAAVSDAEDLLKGSDVTEAQLDDIIGQIQAAISEAEALQAAQEEEARRKAEENAPFNESDYFGLLYYDIQTQSNNLIGAKVTMRGNITQVLNNGDGTIYIFFAAYGEYDQLVAIYVEDPEDYNVQMQENMPIVVYGTYEGLQPFNNSNGFEENIPVIKARAMHFGL